MTWTSLDTWIAVTGVLSAVSCALPGNFLVLRRMSMMGDAISHAVLPGLAAAFLLTGRRDSLTMFIGAGLVGVFTALFVQWVHRLGRVEQSAAMGVVFTTLFALGLLMIVRAADSVDLDPGCVLYGAIELVPLARESFGGLAVPRAVLTLAAVLVVNLLFVLVCYKELKITTFDPALATALGIDASVMHYLLMGLVAATTVASFESVGSILVIAMLIIPGATAHLVTDRLPAMILVSAVVAALSAGAGHLAALTVPSWFGFEDTSTAGMMAVVGGLFFLLAMFFAPRHGLVSKALHRFRLSLRIARDDLLGLLYRLEELGPEQRPILGDHELDVLLRAGPVTRRVVLWQLARSGAVRSQGGYQLTETGRRQARQLVRSHRLWESYLHRFLDLSADRVHPTAHRLEHITDREMRDRLARRLDEAPTDPHGRPIPPESAPADPGRDPTSQGGVSTARRSPRR